MGYDEVKEPSGKAMMLSDTPNFKNLTKMVAVYSAQGWRVTASLGSFGTGTANTGYVLMQHD